MTRDIRVVARRLRWLPVAMVIIVIACGKSSPTAPSSKASLEGVWTGTIADSVSGNGTIRFDMKSAPSPDPTYVAGSWKATFPGAAYEDAVEGGLIAQSTHGMLTATCSFTPPIPNFDLAPSTVMFVVIDNTRMTGNYQSLCNGFGSGTINVTRQ